MTDTAQALCHVCHEPLPPSWMWPSDPNSWYSFNVAPDAASGGSMVHAHHRCRPPVGLYSSSSVHELERELAQARADIEERDRRIARLDGSCKPIVAKTMTDQRAVWRKIARKNNHWHKCPPLSDGHREFTYWTEDDVLRAIAEACALERESCAKVCDNLAWSHKNTVALGPEQNCVRCAAAIRALGEGHD